MHEKELECSLDLLKDYYGKNPTVEKDRCFGKRKHEKF
jgi:hypothetical protein